MLRIYQSKRSDVYYVCNRRTGARVEIGQDYASSSGYTYIGPTAVGGAAAAWQEVIGRSVFYPGCYTSNALEVRDFGRRRQVAAIGLRHNGEATQLVVRRNGSFAWIEARPVAEDGCGEGRTYLVRRRDSRGNAVLAAGESEPRDLRLRGSQLSWADGSGAHGATLR